MSRGRGTGVEEVGETLLRLAMLALLMAGLLKVVAPEFTHLSDELGLGVVPVRAAQEREEQTGGPCRESGRAGRKQGLARGRAAKPRRARKKNTVGEQQSARRQRPSKREASDLGVRPGGARATDGNLPPSEH
jgi:hypothetical protein